MTGISVMDFDYVLVRPAPRVLDGEVAVVLVSENPDHPRRTYPVAHVRVQGRMVARLGLAGPLTLTRRT
jgi:repressor LexA